MGFPDGSRVKNQPAMQATQEIGVQSLEEMATYSSILAWKSHGQRSLAGYSPWGCKEVAMTERLNTHLENISLMTSNKAVQSES